MPICQNISVSTYHASITEQPAQHCMSNPGNYGGQCYRQPCQLRQPLPPLSTLLRYVKLLIATTPHRFPSRSSPAFLRDHVPFTHSLIMSSHHAFTHSPHARHAPRSYIYQHTAHREVRNLFCGTGATAAGGRGIQPRLQAKSISVALPTATESSIPALAVLSLPLVPTATQTRFMPFP
jgi:hypothetical protein